MRTRDSDKQELVKTMTVEIVAKQGLDGFTIAKLAKACGISVGTPYVYYKDKDDLIINIMLDVGAKIDEAMNKDFDPEAPFEEGLRIQWRNRVDFAMEYPNTQSFLDQVRGSAYNEQVLDMFMNQKENFLSVFKKNALGFIANSVQRGEIDKMPVEEYWCLAFAPLYALLRFHHEGRNILGHPFKLSDELLWATFDRVVRALKK